MQRKTKKTISSKGTQRAQMRCSSAVRPHYCIPSFYARRYNPFYRPAAGRRLLLVMVRFQNLNQPVECVCRPVTVSAKYHYVTV